MFLQILFILIIIEGILAQNCQLNAAFMDKKWIYATKPTANTWDVLHTDYIEDRKRLYLICNNAMTNVRRIYCNRGIWQEETHDLTCPRRLKANVVKIGNENSCSQLNGELYQVRYTLTDGSIISLYEVCYSTQNEQSLYARHKAYGFNLAASTYVRPMFSRSNVVSRERELSFKAENIYNTFVRLLGSKQTYVPNEKTLILDRGHLANSQDFLTYDQMDETFKYVNVMPQFRGGNRSNWKRIENWVHNLPVKNTYAEVVTGSIGILSLPHSEHNTQIPMYLMSNEKNPIPLWLYKVVKYKNECYIFATLNNEFNTNSSISPPFCNSTACPRQLEFNPSLNSGVSYCCDYNSTAAKIGSHAILCNSVSRLTKFFNNIFG
ncbi:uncharacterized protein LOC119600591 [Lucilia sericata]|uniref:uncharacterized protein LOC119600591 n=1 Tax=Lucilia sericata TaxID=13632 RepID=UPI0018A83B50|nr:uncharacterized protein LOC119600591 [Lucilia sericata]